MSSIEPKRRRTQDFVWSKDASFHLINLMQKYRPMIMKEKAQKYKHSDVFQLIASQLEVHDIFQTSKQVKIKFDNMQRTYRQIVQNPNRKLQKFPYYSAMQKMFEKNISDPITKQMERDLKDSIERYEMEVLVKKQEVEDDVFDNASVEFLNEEFLEFDDNGLAENQFINSTNDMIAEHTEPFISELMNAQVNERSTSIGEATILVENLKKKIVKKGKELVKSTSTKKAVWSDYETTKLLENYALYKPLLTHTLSMKSYTTSDVYELISQRLLNHKVHRSGSKCCEKLNNLNRTFKNCLKSPNENHSRFKYLSLLKKIHSRKNKTEIDENMMNDVLAVMASRQEQNSSLGVLRLDPVVDQIESSEEFVTVDENVLNDSDSEKSDKNPFVERSFWGIPETERFIQIYTANSDEKHSNGFWKMMSNKLFEEGFEKKSDVTLKQKFSNLRRSFKICEARIKNRRKTKYKFNFYDLMATALYPKTTGIKWTEKQTNELINSFSQVDPFSKDNLFEKVSTILSNRYIKRSAEECASRWEQLTDDLKLFERTGDRTQSFPFFEAVLAAQSGKELVEHLTLQDNIYNVKEELLSEFVDIQSETVAPESIVIKAEERFLNFSTITKLIQLKYEYSLKSKNNSWKLSMEIWRHFTEKLQIFLTPASLKFHFYTLLKKYQLLKMAHEHYGGSINWDYFSAFESAFANKSLNMESALEDLQLATSEKVQYIIDNFMEICKVCLEPCKNMTKLDGSDTQIIKKINYLFYDEDSSEQLDPNISNLICSHCLHNVKVFDSFKKQFKFASQLLVEVVVAPLNANEVMDMDSNDTNEQHIIDESDLLIEIAANAENVISPRKSESKYCIVNGKKRRRRDGVCDVCGIYSKNLSSHLITHATSKRYSCSHCGKKFLRREACRIHIKTHLKIRDYHCQSCTKTFTSIQCLKKHQAVHNRGVVRHTCDICGFGCYLYSVYVVHRANKHGIGLNHVCEICHKGFLYPKRLKHHMNIHNQTKNYPCDSCSKTFTLRASMLNHKRLVHIKGQDCSQCEKSFAYPKMLKDHIEKEHK